MLDGKLNVCFAGGFRSVMQPNRRPRCWALKGVSRTPLVLHVTSNFTSGPFRGCHRGPETPQSAPIGEVPRNTTSKITEGPFELGLSFLLAMLHSLTMASSNRDRPEVSTIGVAMSESETTPSLPSVDSDLGSVR